MIQDVELFDARNLQNKPKQEESGLDGTSESQHEQSQQEVEMAVHKGYKELVQSK